MDDAARAVALATATIVAWRRMRAFSVGIGDVRLLRSRPSWPVASVTPYHQRRTFTRKCDYLDMSGGLCCACTSPKFRVGSRDNLRCHRRFLDSSYTQKRGITIMSTTKDFNVWLSSTKIEDEAVREGLIEGLQRVCSVPGFNIVQQKDDVFVTGHGSDVVLCLETDQDRRNFIKFVENVVIEDIDELDDGFRRNMDGDNT